MSNNPANLRVTIQNQHRGAAPRNLGRLYTRAWQQLDGRAIAITIRLASDADVRRLNTQFRGQSRVTDILTFPDYTRDTLVGGDLIIAMACSRRQAAARGVPLRDELLRLGVHGLAHLAGHDHDASATFATMRKAEFETLITLIR